ncbi:MAG: Gfo/Idh/MocA family oxidoreductase [Chloroflexota bacterium]
MPPTPIGIIGLGLIWIRTHKPILDTMDSLFQPIALCDVDETRRVEAATAFPEAQVFSDYTQLLNLTDIDTVIVLTPISFNAPIALAALQAGKNVIMEKPIARSVAEGQQLITAAKDAGKRLIVLEQMGYQKNAKLIIDLIQSGEVGDLVTWDRVQHAELDTAKGKMRYDTTPWRKTADFPLGTLFDGGIHIIAQLTGLFGAPDMVSATGQTLRPDYGKFDQVSMLFHYENGPSGTFSHSSYLTKAGNHFHIYGTQGVIQVERHQLTIQKPDQPDHIIELPTENPYRSMWQAIAAHYQHDQSLVYTPERAVQDVAILETVDRAIRGRQTLAIPNF